MTNNDIYITKFRDYIFDKNILMFEYVCNKYKFIQIGLDDKSDKSAKTFMFDEGYLQDSIDEELFCCSAMVGTTNGEPMPADTDWDEFLNNIRNYNKVKEE